MGLGLKFVAAEPDVVSAIEALQADATDKIEVILQLVGAQTIAYLRSLTEEIRPPAFRGGPMRRAHPGHWADVTGELAREYSWEVERPGDDVVLVLRNDSGHAVWVEIREGFFVLSGVAEPGGPVEAALKAVIPRVAPGWVVRLG